MRSAKQNQDFHRKACISLKAIWHKIKHSEKIAEINIKSMEDMTMNNSKKETISTSKKIICVVTVIIAVAAAFGLIYGIVRANSMIIFQASSLAAIDTSIICLNFRNIKPANKKSRLN